MFTNHAFVSSWEGLPVGWEFLGPGIDGARHCLIFPIENGTFGVTSECSGKSNDR